jgi:beta-lactamase regulating signal transducer with metallopeptidase domain
LYLLPRRNVQLKYWLSVTALTSLLFWTGYTLNHSISAATISTTEVSGSISGVAFSNETVLPGNGINFHSVKAFINQQVAAINPYMDTLVLVWLLGVLFFLLRLQGSIFYLKRLRSTGSRSVPLVWQQKAIQLSEKLGVRPKVQLLESKLVEVPMVIGHLKPVVLLPMGMLTGLTVAEVEAILAHELAHVKRYDYLINLVQTVVESLLFFNPAVWWISQTIRKHRELCCDDIAVRCCGNQMVYASALSNLGAWSLRSPALGMGLFKTENELLMRIKRLIYPQAGSRTVKEKFVPGLILMFTVLCLSWYSHRVQAQLMPQKAAPMAVQPDPPRKDSANIIIQEEVEVLPPMEPVDVDVDLDLDLENVVEVEWEVDAADSFVISPVMEEFAHVPKIFIHPNMAFVPDIFIDPNIELDIEPLIDLHLQIDDTTRERIMQALEEQRVALERAMAEQEEALEKARHHLRESLEAGKPDDLTDEEWEMAREKIEQAEASLERALEHSTHELERALEDQNFDIQRHIERMVEANVDRNRIVLKHIQDINDKQIHQQIAKAHKNVNRFQYQWDNGNEAELRKTLLKDGLIDEYDSDIALSFTKSQIKINGIKLEGTVKNKYRKMLDDMYGEGSTGSLTFSK